MKVLHTLLIALLSTHFCTAQSLAVNTDGSAANTSAILDVKSTNKGMLLPRMNKAQRNAIPAPATGLLIFQNAPDSSGFYYYTGTGWDWISNPNPPNLWNINGNSGTSPNTNYIGTNDDNDLAFRINNFERMRLTGEASLAIGNKNPKYTLDVSYGEAGINYCDMNGLRIQRANFGAPVCENGLLLGYKSPLMLSDDAVIWNYGQNFSSQNLIFGLGPYERMRLNVNGLLGIGQTSPNYTLDVNVGVAAVNPCLRNGLRITEPNMGNGCDQGLFYGFDDVFNPYRSSSLWNFSDLSNNELSFRVGFGPNFSNTTLPGEVMRILPPGKGVGIGTTTPLAMLHLTNGTGGGALPGVMMTQPGLPAGSMGFYTGVRIVPNNSDGYVWNYQNSPILFGTDDLERMRILANGNIGIGENTPIEKLHVDGNIRTTGLAGTGSRAVVADANGTLNAIAAGPDGQVLTTSGGSTVWQNHPGWSTTGNGGTSPATDFMGTTDAVDLAIRTNNAEALRVTATGNVGIGTNAPTKKTEIIGSSAGTPVTLVVGNRVGFGPAAMEFVSDYGFGSQWRPGYIRSNDIGGFTGAVEIFTNGTGAGNLYGVVKGLEVRNGVTYTATGTVSSFSDGRLKKNMQPFTAGLDIINKINPVSFNYNEQSPFVTDKVQVGVVAQELEAVAPYMVDKSDTKEFEDLRSVNNQAYIFLLINAVKEQDKKIEAMQKQIEEQKKMIDKLLK